MIAAGQCLVQPVLPVFLCFNRLTTASSLKLTAILNMHIMYIMISICYRHRTVGAVSDTVKGPPKDNPIWTCHLGLFLMRWVTNNLLNKCNDNKILSSCGPLWTQGTPVQCRMLFQYQYVYHLCQLWHCYKNVTSLKRIWHKPNDYNITAHCHPII